MVALPMTNGFLVFYDVGDSGGARLYIATAIVLATLLLGFRIGLAVFIAALSGLVLMITLYEFGFWDFRNPPNHPDDSLWRWLFFVVTFVICVTTILVSSGYLVARLKQYSVQLAAESQELERALAAEKLTLARYEMLANNAIDVVWLLSEDMNIQYISPSVFDQLGYTDTEIKAVGFGVLIPASESVLWQHNLFEVKREEEGKGNTTFEMAMLHRNGTEVPVEILSSPIIRDDGQKFAELVVREITERKALEAKLLQSKKIESLGQLAAGVAHDFNNLLTVIQGHVDLLHDSELNEQQKSSVRQIDKTVALATENTRQILSFGRQQALSLQEVELGEMIKEMQPRLLQLIDAQQMNIKAEEAPIHVSIDPAQLERCIINLVVNARDAAPNGEISIHLHTGRYDGKVAVTALESAIRFGVITISDTGSGIDPEIQERIFDPYFSTKASNQGTGLGLSVVLGIIQQHGGFVDVVSAPGQGTSFSVFLPLAH